MGKSLQDQLLNIGLIDKKQVKNANAEKRKQNKQQRKRSESSTENSVTKARVKQIAVEKTQRDRELNQQRREIAERKALASQIRELIEANRIPKDDNGIAFNFNDNNKVKRLYVSENTRRQLCNGRLTVVRIGHQYEVVPSETAEKILSRDHRCVIALNDSARPNSTDDADPYADYQVPDDLVW